jgi:transmembrane secretion effector/LysR substrate binding domain-containing protein
VRISVPTSFALRWLIPRLSHFQREFPDITVRISTTSRKLRYIGSAFDLGIRLSPDPALRSVKPANLVFVANAACFLLVILAVLRSKQTAVSSKVACQSFRQSVSSAARYFRCAPELKIVLVRNFLFALFISAIPAVVPVLGLEALHLNSSNLGLLFTSMGIGSVIGALVIAPWSRARYSSNTLTLSANLLVILAYVLMGFVRQTELFLFVAALAGVGWTLSASELWVAAQRAMPSWARGRMNAAIMMVSQGAMVLGGLIWGTAVAIAGLIVPCLERQCSS